MLVLEISSDGRIRQFLAGEDGILTPNGDFTVEELAEALFFACAPGDPGGGALFRALEKVVADARATRYALR